MGTNPQVLCTISIACYPYQNISEKVSVENKAQNTLEKSYIENDLLKLVIDQIGNIYLGCQRGSDSA